MAGAGFIRRYLSDPGNEVITEIEGVIIIDREPPAAITGLGSGVVIAVGEYENGPFDEPVEVSSGTDLAAMFGSFGYTYDGVPSQNVSARSRLADGALLPEYWNGNGFISLVSKRFRRLIVVRADTSVGAVEFRRLACAIGNNNPQWTLSSGQTVVVDLGAGNVTATFTGVVGMRTSAAGSYPTGFTGGEKMNVTIDDGTDQQIGPVDVVFLASDTTQALVISRINLTLGYTAASNLGGDITRLDGRVAGTSGNVKINSIDVSVATATGFTAGTSAGTGNVGNISKVTLSEATTIIELAVVGTNVERDENGNIRICNTDSDGTAQIEIDGTSTAIAFGFTLDTIYTAASGVAGTIPAGTRVRNVGGTEWVTMQDLEVTAGLFGPYLVKVRPAVDDGTTAGAVAGTVNVVPFAIGLGGFAVINPLPLSAALTEAQIDAVYSAALDTTLNPSSIARECNIIVSARASNAVRIALRNNAINASATGLRGRMTVIRPPLRTSRAIAKATALQPGVGAYRDQRVVYAYPGANIFVPQIAARGTSGGAGFSADGLIDVGFDTWVASATSQLAPEEDPGQLTTSMLAILGVEAGNTDVQNMTIADYTAFKAAGIAALRIDEGVAIIQSGATSVNPATFPNLIDINRRRMADFIEDTLALRLNSFSKKLATVDRRGAIFGEVKAFLEGLLSRDNPATQRIAGYTLDAKSGNTPETLAMGIFRLTIKVRTLASLKFIVLDVTVGTAVEVQELLEAA